ncbi:hypothetical protein JCM16303_005959 [Sporobolomyces ruberrimus]
MPNYRQGCPGLLTKGSCDDIRRCPFNHSLFECEPCDQFFESLNVLESHVAGVIHNSRLAGDFHDLGNGKIECDSCGFEMATKSWNMHVKTKQHRDQNRSSTSEDSDDEEKLIETLKSRIRLSPEGNVDFGLVDFAELTTQTAAYQRVKHLTINVEHHVVLENVMLVVKAQWAVDTRRQVRFASIALVPMFSVQQLPRPVTISPGQSFDISIHFLPRNEIGTHESVLLLDFSATRKYGAEQTFCLTKTLTGTVGVKDDVERFSAKTPYVAPDLQKRPRARRKDTVVAPNDEFKQNVPWTGKLPPFAIPKWLTTLLESDDVKNTLKQLRQELGKLSYRNYEKLWSTVLYAESHQVGLDVRRYDIFNTALHQAEGGRYFLRVEGLAEKRPSVLRADKLKVQICNSTDKHWYEGTVTMVEESRVLLKFAKSFKPASGATFDVQFSVSRIPARRQHQALSQPLPRSQLLFPTLNLELGNPGSSRGQTRNFFSTAIKTNVAQAEAVRSILKKTSGEGAYVVFGPPGTGKTVTIIEACLQLVMYHNATILLTAPSNSAADLLCSRLDLPKDSILRSESSSHRRICECHRSILSGVGLERGHFSHIFVDEAGQATEPETFLPISLADDDTSVVLAGDPKQLGPVVRSVVAGNLGLKTSLLERLMSTPLYDQHSIEYRGLTYTKLVKNYRNHPAILFTSNREFYLNELELCASKQVTGQLRNWEGWPKKDFPIMFHSVKGKDEREGTSPSFFNVAEISIIKEVVESLQSSKRIQVSDSDIGIISPYSAQCKKLRLALNQHDRPRLTIGTVEQFQGSERSVIIMSTVRSNKEFLKHDKRFALGFIGNEKRFNVAVTRPQAGLVIVGDPEILALDPLCRRFLVYIHDNGGWRGNAWDPTRYRDEGFDPAAAARDEMRELTERFQRSVEVVRA